MSLSRKHFEAFAKIVRDLPERPTKYQVADALAAFAANENPNFDRVRFIDEALFPDREALA